MDKVMDKLTGLLVGLYLAAVVFAITVLTFNAYTTVPEPLPLANTAGLKTIRETRLDETVARYQSKPVELLKRAKAAAEVQRQTVKYLHLEAHSLPMPITVGRYKAKVVSHYEFSCKDALAAINQQTATFHRTGEVNIEYLSENVLALERKNKATRRMAERIRARYIANSSSISARNS